jgi:hypothetical protein
VLAVVGSSCSVPQGEWTWTLLYDDGDERSYTRVEYGLEPTDKKRFRAVVCDVRFVVFFICKVFFLVVCGL